MTGSERGVFVNYANDLLDGNNEKYDKSVRPSFAATVTT